MQGFHEIRNPKNIVSTKLEGGGKALVAGQLKNTFFFGFPYFN